MENMRRSLRITPEYTTSSAGKGSTVFLEIRNPHHMRIASSGRGNPTLPKMSAMKSPR
jgi:hypothetical protein